MSRDAVKSFRDVFLAEERKLRECRFRAHRLRTDPLPCCQDAKEIPAPETPNSGSPPETPSSNGNGKHTGELASAAPTPAKEPAENGSAPETPSHGSNGKHPSEPDIAAATSCKEPAELPAFPRTGLALSGGGIRSATFGLGFLQSMYSHEVLRHFDFLSTVSGGSYAGAYLSSAIMEEEKVNWKPSDQAAKKAGHQDLPLLTTAKGPQHPNVVRLRRAGLSLNHPLRFFNQHLLGMLLINLTAFSGVVALAALCAWAYRLLDEIHVQHFLAELGFSGDGLRAWFPSAFLFLMWIFTSWMSRDAQSPIPSKRNAGGGSIWRRLPCLSFRTS